MRMKISRIALAAILVLVCNVMLMAQEDKEKSKTTSEMKEVEGAVTWIGQNKIAILYRIDEAKGEEYEILLPLDEKDLTFVHKKNLAEIGKGDTVNVQYEEITEEGQEGKRTDRKAKIITFVKTGVKKEIATEEGEETLEIRGIRGE
jgi:hypothetical protein